MYVYNFLHCYIDTYNMQPAAFDIRGLNIVIPTN